MTGTALVDTLEAGDHVCSAVRGVARRHALTVEYIDGGLRDGYKVLILDGEPAALRRALLRRRPEAVEALDRGQLSIVPSREAYLPDGSFDGERMADAVGAEIDSAIGEGYPGLRAAGDLSWVGPSGLDGDALIGYEALMNRYYVSHQFIGMCHYEPATLDPAVWRRLVDIHPCLTRSSGDQIVSRLRCRRAGDAVRLAGEADLVNRGALAGLLAASTGRPGECRIDLTGLGFADTSALAGLLRLAAGRHPDRTTIVCPPHLAEILALLGAATVSGLTVAVAGAGGSAGRHAATTTAR